VCHRGRETFHAGSLSTGRRVAGNMQAGVCQGGVQVGVPHGQTDRCVGCCCRRGRHRHRHPAIAMIDTATAITVAVADATAESGGHCTAQLVQIENASSFHVRNDSCSIISCPGKAPYVTAFRSASCMLVLILPTLFPAKRSTTLFTPTTAFSSFSTIAALAKNSTNGFW